MRRKIIILLLSIISVFCLAFGISACSGTGDSSSDSGNTSQSQTDNTDSSSSDNTGDSSNNSSDDDEDTTPSVVTYTVTYDSNGGTFADGNDTYTQTANSGSTLIAPTSPTCEGYTFAGWTTSKNGSVMWSFSSDTVTADITLYASWKEKTASILSVDNASIDGENIFMFVDSSDSLSLSSMVTCSSDSTWKLYYDELGQTEIPTRKTGTLSDGDNYFYIVVTSTDSTIVNSYVLDIYVSYAVNVKYYNEFYSYYYHNSPLLLKTETAYTGYTFNTDYIPSITGYTFNYWAYSDGTAFTAKTLWGNLSLYASKTANDYTVTYDVNGGDELTETTATVTYDSSYTLTVPARANYTFIGWYLDNTQLTNNKGASLSAWKYSSDKILTAMWTPNNYTVTLNCSDSSAGTVTGSGSHSYTSSVTIAATTNSGYTWVGWYDENEELVTTGLSYTFEMPAKNITFTAKWAYYTLTTTTNNNDAGTVTEYSQTKITAENAVTVTATTNSGYTWVGWYDENEELVAIELSYTFEMPTNNVTYIAKWSNTVLAITINEAGSISSIDGKYVVGDTVLIKASEANLGYNWAGWYIGDKLYTTEYSFTHTMNEKNIIYTAHYELKSEMSNFKFYSTTSTCSITAIKDNAATEIVVPDYVTSIDSGAFSGCSSLKSITLPFVGSSASAASASSSTLFGYIFGTTSYTCGTSTKQYYASSSYITYYIPTILTTVTITGGNIFYGAFYNCTSLTSVTIGDNVLSIESRVFSGCSSLVSMTLPFVGSSANATSASSSTLFGYIFGTNSYTGGTSTKQYYSSGSYKTYYIPTTLMNVIITGGTILYGAFYDCSSLTNIVIPDSITSIDDSAFTWCESLTSITIPDSVTTIGSSAFLGCTSLISVTIGSGVESIGNYAFSSCYKLVEVYNLSSLTITAGSSSNGYVGNYALYVYTSADTESNLLAYGDYTFYCDDDGNYYLVRYNGSEAELTLPTLTVNGETVSYSIYQYAFYKSTKITSITIPESVTSIDNYAFSYCTVLSSVTLGSGITSIGSNAFGDCTVLTKIYFNATAMNDLSSGTYAFYNAGKNGDGITVTIGAGVTKIPAYLFYGYNYYSRSYVPNITSVVFENNSICESIGRSSFYYCTSLNSIVIPSGVTSIGNSAFRGCTSLTNITIPDNVTSIGSYAFYGCSSLKSVIIGSSVTVIEIYTFSGCTSLTSVTFTNTSGWNVTTTYGATSGTTILSSDLSNTSTAATYLTSTYNSYYWKRSGS